METRPNADSPAAIGEDDVLIVVDVQRDFCPGGALAVPHGDVVVPVLNRLIPCFSRVVFTRDWHPAGHVSFAAEPAFEDGSWPPHGVQGTEGAAFHPDLDVPAGAVVVSKGTERDTEAYSAFSGSATFSGPGLAEKLMPCGRVFVGGLAAEYCVKSTVLDAIAAGFAVVVIEDAVRGIDSPPGSCEAAFEEMRRAGARTVRAEELVPA